MGQFGISSCSLSCCCSICCFFNEEQIVIVGEQTNKKVSSVNECSEWFWFVCELFFLFNFIKFATENQFTFIFDDESTSADEMLMASIMYCNSHFYFAIMYMISNCLASWKSSSNDQILSKPCKNCLYFVLIFFHLTFHPHPHSIILQQNNQAVSKNLGSDESCDFPSNLVNEKHSKSWYTVREF